MDDWKLGTTVAFLIFNRPDTTLKVFEEIRRAKPPKLLVVADGPRQTVPGEADRCAAARAVIDTVDWPCEVIKNYAESNLGCRKRVSTGLDWVFKTVNEAIILEDDCLPHPSFFRFCEDLLDRYREDERIMMISGFNFLGKRNDLRHSYFFSRYPHIWGWASWSTAWKYYDVDMKIWPELRDIHKFTDLFESRNEKKIWENCFDNVYNGAVDTWDAQVTFMFLCQNALAIFPCKNLITNIGFGRDATHTNKYHESAFLPPHEIEFPLNHPRTVSRDSKNDTIRMKREYSSSKLQLLMKILRRIQKSCNFILE